jgi:phosphoribosyl 1,2-cyclic phosphodiesterase
MLSHLVSIRFWGVRGSVPTPGPGSVYYGGNTSCIEVRADGELIILDAGTGIKQMGKTLLKENAAEQVAAGAEPPDLTRMTLLISHTHWDHIQGLPFFQPAYQPGSKLDIWGPESVYGTLESALSGQMFSLYFPVPFSALRADLKIRCLPPEKLVLGNVKVDFIPSNHPGGSVGYRLHTSCGAIGYIPDHEPYNETGGNGDLAEIHYLGTPSAPVDVASRQAEFMKFIHGLDVLILDTQYTEEEYRTRVGWGHGYLENSVELAIQAGVKQIFLFHHDPEHEDAFIDEMVARAQEIVQERHSTLVVSAAREGEHFTLPERACKS